MAGHRLAGESLHYEPSQAVERHHVFELNAVAKRTTGGNHRILQLDAGNLNAQLQSSFCRGAHGRGSCGGRDLAGGAATGGADGTSASVSTRPVALVGLLIPSRTARVGAKSIGSTCSR